MNLDALKNLTQPPAPKGWEPGVQWHGHEGFVTTQPTSDSEGPRDDQWDHVLEQFGLNPEQYMIDGPVRHSVWDVPGHGTQRAYRARIVLRPERTFDIEDVLECIYGEFEPVDHSGTPAWRNIVLSDTHIGKSEEDGGGTEKIIERWKNGVTVALSPQSTYEGVNIILGGDTIEGYVSQDGKGIGSCDLTLTEQIRVANHLVSWTIQEALGVAPVVNVAVCPGNHGESTRQAQVSMTDSWDVQIVNNVQQAMDMAGLSDRVNFYYPAPGTGDVTWTAGDTTFTLVHGHKFKGGPVKGAESWWSGQITNDRPAKDSHVLVYGHFHGYRSWCYTRNRWIMSAPALEDQSTWFANQTGATAFPGVLCFDTAESRPWNINIA